MCFLRHIHLFEKKKKKKKKIYCHVPILKNITKIVQHIQFIHVHVHQMFNTIRAAM